MSNAHDSAARDPAAPTPANDTKTRILETAWTLMRERGIGVPVGEIAAAAGVSRQLVYVHFSSRPGLLVAMTRYQDVRSGFRERAWATRELPPVEAFEALTRAWCAYAVEIMPVALELEAALIAGADGAVAWRDRMGELHEAFRFATARLEEADSLATGWTAETAADWAWAQVQPSNWLHLVHERGWTQDEYVDRTVASIFAQVANV
jgi:AcrR family transcriptional regulator